MKKLILFLVALFTLTAASAKVDKQVATFYVDLHCQGCCDKVMKNIAFEKGVKDLACDLKAKTVTVTYDANKTNVETLQKAFAKIGKPASLKPCQGNCQGACGASCGGSCGASCGHDHHDHGHDHHGHNHSAQPGAPGHGHDHSGHVDATSGATQQHK